MVVAALAPVLASKELSNHLPNPGCGKLCESCEYHLQNIDGSFPCRRVILHPYQDYVIRGPYLVRYLDGSEECPDYYLK